MEDPKIFTIKSVGTDPGYGNPVSVDVTPEPTASRSSLILPNGNQGELILEYEDTSGRYWKVHPYHVTETVWPLKAGDEMACFEILLEYRLDKIQTFQSSHDTSGERGEYKWHEPKPLPTPEPSRNDLVIINLPVSAVFTWSEEIPDEVDEEDNVVSYKSGWVLEVLPSQFQWNGEPYNLIGHMFSEDTKP